MRTPLAAVFGVIGVLGLAAPAAVAIGRSSVSQVPSVRYVDQVFDRVEVTPNVQYGQATRFDGTVERLLLDLYQPAGDDAAARPVAIFAHGGSLNTGDKSDAFAVTFAQQMARRGYVAASINYRLLTPFGPTSGLPSFAGALNPNLVQGLKDAQHDMQAAVRWFRANATSLHVDPTRIVVAGDSAGAGVALYANYNASDPGDSGNPGYPSDVSATVSYSGSLAEPSSIRPGAPPILMINALDDKTAPYPFDVATTCAPALAAGDVCAFTTYSKGGHGLNGHGSELLGGAADFLCQYVAECKQ